MIDRVWPVEDIPDADLLFYRIHQNQLIAGAVHRGCFRERGDAGKPVSMSTDWSRYSTPLESRSRARLPADNLIVALQVGDVRALEHVSVVHSPVQDHPTQLDNRSHTDVLEINRDPETRDRLAELASVVLPLDTCRTPLCLLPHPNDRGARLAIATVASGFRVLHPNLVVLVKHQTNHLVLLDL